MALNGKARAVAPHADAHHVRLAILHVYDASVTLRSPPTFISMRARGGGTWGRKPLLRQNRQQRHPCAPRVCSGRLHSGFTPTYTRGHA
eukprot:6368638-Prymnesium_polylepis.1